MKIGIMTFCHAIENYGQIMQCFALQRHLRNLGHDAFVIDFGRKPKTEYFWKRLGHALNPFYYRSKRHALAMERSAFPRKFDEFLDKYVVFSPVKYNEPTELKENPPEADVFIVGSDQVWSEWRLSSKKGRPKIDVYFLNFGENVRRLSFAASWGQNEISDDFGRTITPLLEKFCAIGVREKTGIDICRKLGFEDAKWTCDPTFLLDAEEYRRIYRENPVRKRERKYLLIYFQDDDTDFDFRTIYDFAKEKGLEVVYVSVGMNVGEYERFFATIPEWLYLIDNAEYVVTNSFHGTVFSTIFGKQYGVIPCTDKRGTLANGRFDSLFEVCNIAPRWLVPGEGFSVLDKPYSADISSFRAESIRFLDDALKKVQEGTAAPRE